MNMRGTEDIYIRESGVCFGPFPPDCLFYMEKSLAFRNLGPGYSTVEFLFADAGKNFFFVEAKSSSPRPQKDSVDFDDFINKVAVKFQDSYQLFLAGALVRRNLEDAGLEIQQFQAASAKIKFLLVIPGHRKAWLAPLQDALKQRLYKTIHMWNIDVAVLNEELARDYDLLADDF